jgi:hypothetical protein
LRLFTDTNPDPFTQRYTKSNTNCNSYSDSNCNSDGHSYGYCNSNRHTVPNSAEFCGSGHNHRDRRPEWPD